MKKALQTPEFLARVLEEAEWSHYEAHRLARIFLSHLQLVADAINAITLLDHKMDDVTKTYPSGCAKITDRFYDDEEDEPRISDWCRGTFSINGKRVLMKYVK
jgi:hypothetical protein